MTEKLMSIGVFSKSCRLTIKALRHYDNQNLLKPAYIDPETGYRYYKNNQAREAVLISMLRSLEIPLSRIKDFLNANDHAISELFKVEQQRVKQELDKKQQILHSIDRLALEGDLFPYDISTQLEPNYIVAKYSCVTNSYNIIKDSGALIYNIHTELVQQNRDYESPVMCINEDPDENDNIIVHGCIGVQSPYPKLKNASIEEIPGGLVAILTHQGDYETLGIAYHSLFAWAQENNYTQRDSMREIYLNDPSEVETKELLTTVILPVTSNENDGD